MRCFVPLTCLGLVLVLSSLGCGNGSANGSGGSGGAGGTGGTGGTGGNGGMGGGGGPVRPCNGLNDCIDFGRDPCITSMCIDQICHFDSLPDDTACAAETGQSTLSTCVGGICQPIWASCEDEGAQDGDFCQPTEDMQRLGRCESGICEVNPCEITFDCWDGDPCMSDICDTGECRHENVPNGTNCGLVLAMECIDGICVRETGGTGGQGGQGGQGGGG